MRGAHRGVWCSKAQPLIEAELFAAERRRPAPSGRALLCAADNARKIQGITATYKLKTHGTEPRFSRFAARPKGVAAQRRVWGSQEGAREPYGALAPFCLRRQTAAFSPVNTGTPGRRRRPMSTLTLSVNLASSGAPLYRRNRLPSAEGKRGTFAALRRNILHCAAGFDMMKIPERGRII